MVIKKYNDFLLEKYSPLKTFQENFDKLSDPDLSDEDLKGISWFFKTARNYFSDKVGGLRHLFNGSYNNSLASDVNADPEEDFSDIQKVLDVIGYNLDIISKLFDDKVSKLIGQDFESFIKSNSFDSINGYIDIYFYLLNKKLKIDENYEIILSGAKLEDYILDIDSQKTAPGGLSQSYSEASQEILIKYSYGYHTTKYGKLLFEQSNLKIEGFLNTVLKAVKNTIEFNSISRANHTIKSLKLTEPWPLIDFYFSKYITSTDNSLSINYTDIAEYYTLRNDAVSEVFSIERFEEILKKSIFDELGNQIPVEELEDKIEDEESYFHLYYKDDGNSLIFSL